MEETISLREIYVTLKKRLVMIVILAVLAVAAVAIYSYYFVTPMYQTSTQILVNQSKEEGQFVTSGDIRTNMDLINTYNVIITSPRILDHVREELQLERSADRLRGQITVGSERNSQVIYLQVQDADPAMAAVIANTTASVFEREIVDIMSVDNVSILSSAEVPGSPVSPNPQLNMAIALVVGLMAGVGLAFLLEFLDNTVKSEDQLEQLLGVPTLGTISRINENNVEMKKLAATKSSRTGRENIGA